MTYETSDLQSRVARYEAAVEELRAAHQDVRSVLQDQVLFARWQQMGVELGFVAAATAEDAAQPGGPAGSANQQIPQMAESWAG
jgi:hypothetical protein